MAEFCKECNYELFDMPSDFAGLTTQEDWELGLSVVVLCEGCGPIQVDPDGKCISNDCPKHGEGGN